MQVSTGNLVDILQEIETAGPIDYADLPFGEKELRRLVVGSLAERHLLVQKDLNVDDVHAMYLLGTARALLENTVLHAPPFASARPVGRRTGAACAIQAENQT